MFSKQHVTPWLFKVDTLLPFLLAYFSWTFCHFREEAYPQAIWDKTFVPQEGIETSYDVWWSCLLCCFGDCYLPILSEWRWFCFQTTCSASNMWHPGSLKWTPCCCFFCPTSAGRFAMFGRRRIDKYAEIRLSSPKNELKLHMMSVGPARFVVLETVTCPCCLSDSCLIKGCPAGFVSEPLVQKATWGALAL